MRRKRQRTGKKKSKKSNVSSAFDGGTGEVDAQCKNAFQKLASDWLHGVKNMHCWLEFSHGGHKPQVIELEGALGGRWGAVLRLKSNSHTLSSNGSSLTSFGKNDVDSSSSSSSNSSSLSSSSSSTVHVHVTTLPYSIKVWAKDEARLVQGTSRNGMLCLCSVEEMYKLSGCDRSGSVRVSLEKCPRVTPNSGAAAPTAPNLYRLRDFVVQINAQTIVSCFRPSHLPSLPALPSRVVNQFPALQGYAVALTVRYDKPLLLPLQHDDDSPSQSPSASSPSSSSSTSIPVLFSTQLYYQRVTSTESPFSSTVGISCTGFPQKADVPLHVKPLPASLAPRSRRSASSHSAFASPSPSSLRGGSPAGTMRSTGVRSPSFNPSPPQFSTPPTITGNPLSPSSSSPPPPPPPPPPSSSPWTSFAQQFEETNYVLDAVVLDSKARPFWATSGYLHAQRHPHLRTRYTLALLSHKGCTVSMCIGDSGDTILSCDIVVPLVEINRTQQQKYQLIDIALYSVEHPPNDQRSIW
jgi:hypothetical protein